MIRRIAAALLLLACSSAVHAQKPPLHRIGFVTSGAPGTSIEAFRQGLKEAGYVEGKDIHVEARFANGRQEVLPDLLAELVAQPVDVLVVVSTATAIAAKKATTRIPIVFASVFDPVAAGLVASLARPGGNITGTAMGVGGSFGGKWVELLKEAVPGMSHAAVLWNPANASSAQSAQAIEAAARSLNVRLEMHDAGNAAKLDAALKRIASSRADALIIAPDPYFNANRTRLVRFAASRRLPAIYFFRSFADAGGLMSYGASNADSIRSAARHVDRILKGAHPSQLPIDQPTRFDLVVNLKTAKTLGLKLPRSLIVRADQIIE